MPFIAKNSLGVPLTFIVNLCDATSALKVLAIGAELVARELNVTLSPVTSTSHPYKIEDPIEDQDETLDVDMSAVLILLLE